MPHVDLLNSVVQRTAVLLDGVSTEHHSRPTPCPDYDVVALVNHIVGWTEAFATAAEGGTIDGDPGAATAGERPAEEFRAAGSRAVAAFRGGATERPLQFMSGELPGQAVLDMMLMEVIGHGWDLATATGQPVPYDDREAQTALDAGRTMLRPDFRGPGKPFGEEVPVAPDAPVIQQLVAFLGRTP